MRKFKVFIDKQCPNIFVEVEAEGVCVEDSILRFVTDLERDFPRTLVCFKDWSYFIEITNEEEKDG